MSKHTHTHTLLNTQAHTLNHLVRVEEVSPQAGNGLHIGGVQSQHVLVVNYCVQVQRIVYSGYSEQKARLRCELRSINTSQ